MSQVEGDELTSKAVLDSLFTDHFNLDETPDGGDQLKPSGDEESSEQNEAASRFASAVFEGEETPTIDVDDGDETPKEEVKAPEGDEEKPKIEKVIVKKKKVAPSTDAVYEIPKSPQPREQVPQRTQEEDLSFLNPEQRDEYNLIRWGENKFPDRFKGRSKDLLAYYKSHTDFVQRRSTELEEQGDEFDSHDTEYQKWLKKNQPKFSYEDRRDLREEMLAEKIIQRVDPRLRQQEEEIRLQKIRPIHDQLLTEAVQGFEEAVKADFDAEDHFEQEIAKAIKLQTQARIAQYLTLSETPEIWDEKNQAHLALDEFITRQGNSFYQKGGEARFRDGKKFLPMSEFLDLSTKERQGYWTFSEADIVKMLRRQGEVGLKLSVKNHRERMSSSGYVRQKQVEEAPKKEEPKKETPKSPKITSSPSGGRGAASGKDLVEDLMGTLYPKA